MRLPKLIPILFLAFFALHSFGDSYSKQKDLSPPGYVLAQNDIANPLLSLTVNGQPISVNHEIAQALPFAVNESEGMVLASVALPNSLQSTRLTSKSFMYSKSNLRRTYIENMEKMHRHQRLC